MTVMTAGRGFLEQDGEMAARIRATDWSAHPLGPPASWPGALRTALGIALGSSFPTAIYWGPELHLLYNDAWSVIPAKRHPWALGRPAAEVWADIWLTVGPQFADAQQGRSTATHDEMLPMVRGGIARQTYWNYSLSPIRDEDGAVGGVFNQGSETTRAVMAERQNEADTERLREMFEQAPVAFTLLRGPEFVIEFANQPYRDLVGARDIIGRTVAEALPEIEEQGFVAMLQRVFATGEAYRAEAAEVTLNRQPGGTGDLRYIDFVYQPIRDASGEVTDILALINDVTVRVEAEVARRASEERLQLALDSSEGIGTWDWDIGAAMLRIDERFAKLYGAAPEAVSVGFPVDLFFESLHPDDSARVRAAVERAIETGERYESEFRLRRPDGSVVWVVAQGRVMYDAAGRPSHLPGVSFDITKRRAAEEAARNAAGELQLAIEAQAFVFRLAERLRSLDDQVAILRLSTATLGRRLATDRVGYFRLLSDDVVQYLACWTSERLEPLTGTMPLADFGASNVARYHAGETLAFDDYRTDPGLSDSRIGKLAGAGIGAPLMRGGRWTASLYANQASPRHWTGEEIALVEAVAEVTWDAVDRATAVAGLRESEEKFRAIANSIDQMVWSTRPDGFHDYYNERWHDFTGMPSGSTDGEAWNGMFHPDDQDRAWSAWRHSLATGEPYRIEYRLRHHSGEYRWVLGSAQAVRDVEGRITRWFGTCTVIEEIVEAREVLARSRAELEEAVIERTRQLMATEEQLRQAQKMEAVGQLTGGIAHDFNNMLAVVIGALDLLDRRIAQGRTDVGRYVEAARDGATRAAALTQRLLSFSRQSALAPAAIDLNAMVAGMTELLSRTIGEAITVETQLDPGLWRATADPSQIENAIINLAVNARDAMPRGGRLTIATANARLDDAAAEFALPPGDYVRIAVGDTGSGMDNDIAARAFDPFFTTKSVGKGTGLGLSQVFGFVRQSGGHVGIDTAPGRGTTVTILLPRDTSDAAPAPTVHSSAPESRGSSEEIILVVEDEERVRSYSVEALRELGYGVAQAPDGPSALRMIAAGHHVSLLFTDVVMPEMTGRELATAARTILPGLKVLYTSGYTRDAIPGDGEGESAGRDVLGKPFDVATLAARIRAALDA